MRTLLFAAVLAVGPGAPGSATAQVYPSRPITMVAPFPAGAPVDMVGRIVAERMRVPLGQPIIIENVAAPRAASASAAPRVRQPTATPSVSATSVRMS